MEKEISEIDKKIKNTEIQLNALRRQKAKLEDKEKWFVVIINSTKIEGGQPPMYLSNLNMYTNHHAHAFEDREDAQEYVNQLKEKEEYSKDHYFYIADIEKPKLI